ncbi:unnamed protein product [Caenorhabditis auriculariae]|uniref:Uncharacterized protein n=1 Tax=Caenorhabditis auriculariae TaxID=2777116 RepID=A0A8S1HV88_9PELO|nr:unnamed protein product [Caenorhabditis auriculariae]
MRLCQNSRAVCASNTETIGLRCPHVPPAVLLLLLFPSSGYINHMIILILDFWSHLEWLDALRFESEVDCDALRRTSCYQRMKT